MRTNPLLFVLSMSVFISGGCVASSDDSYRKMLSNSVSTAYPELLAHFPATVPANARVVKVSHFSGWGTRWAARIEGVDADFLNSLRRQYPVKDPGLLDEGSFAWPWLAPALGVKGTFTDYETVLLKTRSGNHGHRAGISMSKQGRDALFWAERW